MNYNVVTTAKFDKKLKRLAKKYTSLKTDLAYLIDQLVTEPDKGISLGRDCYKIRLAITSKGRGKSGGARVITHFAMKNNQIILLSIYDKAEQSSINDTELLKLLALTV